MHTHPPKFGIRRLHSQRWFLKGQQFVASLPSEVVAARTLLSDPQSNPNFRAHVQQAINYATLFANDHQFVPAIEDSIHHHNEADVVRTAALYLIHPVAQALSARPSHHRAFVSKSEDVGSSTRADVVFYRNDSNNERPFSVIEFKRRTMVHGPDFSHDERLRVPQGTPNPSGLLQQIVAPFVANHPSALAAVQAFNSVVQATNIPPGETMFSPGTEKLIKQCAAYSIQHRTRHVVLFNYDYMICCYFPWLDTSLPVTRLRHMNATLNQDYPVEVDIYPRMSGPNTANPELRLALLGFLHDAITDTHP